MCGEKYTQLCSDEKCLLCYERSFASFQDKKKVDCLVDKNPRFICKTTNKKYKFKCYKCNHIFYPYISEITLRNGWCSYCDNKKLCQDENCQICYNKSFASYEDKEKVKCLINENPRFIFKSSNKKYKFKCNDCDHIFPSSPNFIFHKNSWCSFCSNNKLCQDVNCQICFNKSFASYKGKTTNGKLKIKCLINGNPRNIFKSSHKEYSFKCDICNHIFLMTPDVITRQKNHWCSYCADKNLCQDNNCQICFNKSFASYTGKTINSKLKIKCLINENPRFIFKSSNKKYKFKCDMCDNTFPISINSITRKEKRWCSYCKNKTEQIFYNYFLENYSQLNIIFQAKYKWCKNKTFLPFDFCIEELKIIIEIDGRQHFEQVKNWKSPEENFKRDIFKMKKALENNYTIIRIIQEDVYNDKNDWKNKLDKVLKKYETSTIFYIGCQEKYKKYIEFFKSEF